MWSARHPVRPPRVHRRRRRRSRSRSERRRSRRDKKRSRRSRDKEHKLKPDDIHIKQEPLDGTYTHTQTHTQWVEINEGNYGNTELVLRNLLYM